MNIGIDIDDTISETFETLLPYSQKYTIEDLKRKSNISLSGDFSDHFYIVHVNGWNEKEALVFWEKYYAEILRELNIKKFAAETIKRLKKQGHKVYLITARWTMRAESVEGITEQWLKENNVEYDELILNASDKLSVAKEKNIDIFIDDSFNNCKSIAYGTNAKVYLMNTRMNEKLSDKKVKRVYSWPEVYNLISK